VTTTPDRPRRRLFRPIRDTFRDPEGKVILASAATLLAVGTVVYSFLEGWSPLDSLYFSVVTLATVGYGDLHPTTDAAKVFTIGYILAGIGIVATFASEIAKHRVPRAAVPPVSEGADRADAEVRP
jgi:voltage-gated potassium channel